MNHKTPSRKHRLGALIWLNATYLLLSLSQLMSISAYAYSFETTKINLKPLIEKFDSIFSVFYAIVILTNILIFIYHFMQLGATASNPSERSKVIKDIFISGICLALTGGSGLVFLLLFTTVMG